jgi:cytosine/adenosine deaminase-related metal-dependent hydrolase
MVPAGSVLAAATVDSAGTIGLGGVIGAIEPGRRADVILLDGLGHLLGAGDLSGAVVTALRPSDVRTVVVDGRVVKRDGRLIGLDLARLRQSAVVLARRAVYA